MKPIIKAYKFRIYPTVKQEILLAKHFGCARFVYNHFLDAKIKAYEKDKTTISGYGTMKLLTTLKQELSWLKEVSAKSLQQSLLNLDTAYKNFFRTKKGFPKFKSKYRKQSFKLSQNSKIKGNKLHIIKFKEGIKIVQDRSNIGTIKNVTVSKTPSGKYYASLCCEVKHKPYKKTGSKIGIDTGIKNLAILSNSKVYENNKPLENALKDLVYSSRVFSKKVKGSNSRNRARLKLARVHEKVSNKRRDYNHKVTTEIVKNHDVIVVEDLAIKNMMKNHRLSQAFSDVALGDFYKMLEYKCDWNDKQFVKIDRFYPSSKTCSCCEHIYKDLTLSMRKWQCSQCGTIHDRDFNAANNILNQGMKIMSGCGMQSYNKQKQEEESPLGDPMKPEVQLSLG